MGEKGSGVDHIYLGVRSTGQVGNLINEISANRYFYHAHGLHIAEIQQLVTNGQTSWI